MFIFSPISFVYVYSFVPDLCLSFGHHLHRQSRSQASWGWGGRDDCQISTINSFGKKNEFFIESNEFISIETDFLAKMQHLYDPLGPKQNLIFWPKKLVSE